MKSAKDILLEMGFKKGGSASTKEAFIKNLVKHANQTSGPKSELSSGKSNFAEKNNEPQQLSFDFEDDSNNKKLVG